MEEAQQMRKSLCALTRFEQFKEYESELKDLAAKICGKEELLIDLELDEKLAAYRSLESFVRTAKEALRAWKAFVHAGNDKNMRAFQKGWAAFRPVMDRGAAQDLLTAAAHDMIKGLINKELFKGTFSSAAGLCRLEYMTDQYELQHAHAAPLQLVSLQHILRQLVRKFHNQAEELPTQWSQTVDAAGQSAMDTICLACRWMVLRHKMLFTS